MKTIKKLFCFLLVLSVFLFTNVNAYSENNSSRDFEEAELFKALDCAYEDRECNGLSNIDFSLLSISSVIKSYEYTSNGFIESMDFYPLFYNNELCAFAIRSELGNASYYQITTLFVDEIKEQFKDNNSFAFVYCNDGCYLYNGNYFKRLYSFLDNVESRKNPYYDLPDKNQLSKIQINRSDSTESLNYSPNPSRSSVYLSVGYVSQSPYNKICWAACTACITNYLSNTNYTAAGIASTVFGDPNDFNYGLTSTAFENVLHNYTGKSYIYHNYVPSDTAMYNNFSAYRPIVGSFYYANGAARHAVVIRGIDTSTRVLSIMDPQSGWITSTYINGWGYWYTDPLTAIQWEYVRAYCIYWS